ncbi:hypothetical protein CHS0354_001723 [Potamilus streckersoni]|uniref:Uncharacterized protein n=1 Tax=Potamilus streckersoni TaxID=2493646 RepID=A0AAE0S399_9BIVA|nr:hypothetical protein CHS0354_001723 [Potamilus streckersoni]
MLSSCRRQNTTSKGTSKGRKRNRDESRKDIPEINKTRTSIDDGKTNSSDAIEAKSPERARRKIFKGSKLFGKKVLGAAYLNKAGDALVQAGDVLVQAGGTVMKAGLAGRDALMLAGIAGRDAIMYAGQTGRDVLKQAGQAGRDVLFQGLTHFIPGFEFDQTKADKSRVESFPVVEEDGMLINYVKIIADAEDKEAAIALTDYLTPLKYEDTVDYYRNMSTTRHNLIKVVLILSDLLAQRKVDGYLEEWKKYIEKVGKDAKEWQRKCSVSNKLYAKYRRVAHPRELERTLAFWFWNHIENYSHNFGVAELPSHLSLWDVFCALTLAGLNLGLYSIPLDTSSSIRFPHQSYNAKFKVL